MSRKVLPPLSMDGICNRIYSFSILCRMTYNGVCLRGWHTNPHVQTNTYGVKSTSLTCSLVIFPPPPPNCKTPRSAITNWKSWEARHEATNSRRKLRKNGWTSSCAQKLGAGVLPAKPPTTIIGFAAGLQGQGLTAGRQASHAASRELHIID